MNGWKCNSCGLEFTEPAEEPQYVDDSGYVAFSIPVCPYCGDDDIEEVYDFGDEDDDAL